MIFKWHIWFVIDSWSLTAPIRNSVRGRTEFCKITMTSGRRNLHFLTPTLLLIFDRRPPPWYSLQLPLKSKMAATISLRKYWALARQNCACSVGSLTTSDIFRSGNTSWKLHFLGWIQTDTFIKLIDWLLQKCHELILKLQKKRFTKEFRAQLAIFNFDIQLTWKDPENANGIQGNLKDNC